METVQVKNSKRAFQKNFLRGIWLAILVQFGCQQMGSGGMLAAPPSQVQPAIFNQQMLPSGGDEFDSSAVRPASYQETPTETTGLNPVAQNQVSGNRRSIAHRWQSSPLQEKGKKTDVGTLFDPSTGRGIEAAGGAAAGKIQVIKKVVILGNKRVPTAQIIRQLKTKVGRYLDPDLLQQDVQAIWRMETIRRVTGPYLKESPRGVIVTFEVKEHPVIQDIRFVGNRVMTDAALKREIGLEVGKPLNDFEIRLAKDKIQQTYQSKGYTHTHVELLDSKQPGRIVFNIYEDLPKKISKVTFHGNKVAPDGRLKMIIQSKPQFLGFFGGNFDRAKADRDTEKLTAYYFALGYFNARIGREIVKKPGSEKVELRFVVNEGKRYRVRHLKFNGNQSFDSQSLRDLVKLKPSDKEMPFFEKAQMDKDVNMLRDSYGANGYIFAKIQAQPRFLEEPGMIDLVYRVEEGKPYRVGKINIFIEGDGVTRRSVVWNRMIQKPGELIDIRKVRQSERLLNASQLFGDPNDPNSRPKITIKPASGEATSIR